MEEKQAYPRKHFHFNVKEKQAYRVVKSGYSKDLLILCGEEEYKVFLSRKDIPDDKKQVLFKTFDYSEIKPWAASYHVF